MICINKSEEKVSDINIKTVFNDLYNTELEQALKNMDKQIEILNISIPDNVAKKLNKHFGISFYRKKSFQDTAINITSSIVLFFILIIGITIYKPTLITAVINTVKEISFLNSDNSTHITVADKHSLPFEIDLPYDFSFEFVKVTQHLDRYAYENHDNYIEFTIYADNISVSLDNDTLDSAEKIEFNGRIGNLYENSGVVKIVSTLDEKIFVIKSDLPKEAFMEIVNTICEN